MILEFMGVTKTLAIKKAINYWYLNFYGKLPFSDFIKNCVIKKIDLNFIVIYRDFSKQIDGYNI